MWIQHLASQLQQTINLQVGRGAEVVELVVSIGG